MKALYKIFALNFIVSVLGLGFAAHAADTKRVDDIQAELFKLAQDASAPLGNAPKLRANFALNSGYFHTALSEALDTYAKFKVSLKNLGVDFEIAATTEMSARKMSQDASIYNLGTAKFFKELRLPLEVYSKDSKAKAKIKIQKIRLVLTELQGPKLWLMNGEAQPKWEKVVDKNGVERDVVRSIEEKDPHVSLESGKYVLNFYVNPCDFEIGSQIITFMETLEGKFNANTSASLANLKVIDQNY